ncbi:ABC transporter permease [Cohnella abietis]|uniref:Glutathione ABC transporter permease GsiD n=1 Tax=Cohnella abietis TaxID=2507935 RepID=A0A3T1DBV0_9BACL|nr:ABC transporter permease [Cohnella abietis]BBI35573.1 glutathione ABC transporter permease GsiD [Cohnella abietis]
MKRIFPTYSADWLKPLRKWFVRWPVVPAIAAAWIVFVALAALATPWLSPFDPNYGSIMDGSLSPSWKHWLGTDQQGRDIATRLLTGAGPTLIGALLCTLLAAAIGALNGLAAGLNGRWTDRISTTVWDIIMAIPGLILALVLVTVLGRNIYTASLALAIVNVPVMGRLVRAEAKVLRRTPYVEAALLAGASNRFIIWKHLLPGIIPVVFARSSLTFGYAILDLSALSYLGVGVQPPAADWGAMLAQGRHTLLVSPLGTICAGLAITLTALSFQFIGDEIQRRWSPKR